MVVREVGFRYEQTSICDVRGMILAYFHGTPSPRHGSGADLNRSAPPAAAPTAAGTFLALLDFKQRDRARSPSSEKYAEAMQGQRLQTATSRVPAPNPGMCEDDMRFAPSSFTNREDASDFGFVVSVLIVILGLVPYASGLLWPTP